MTLRVGDQTTHQLLEKLVVASERLASTVTSALPGVPPHMLRVWVEDPTVGDGDPLKS